MDHHLLVSELQSLVAETRRRNTDVKDAAEHALALLKAPVTKELLDTNSDNLIAPILLGCKTKNVKIVGISISALQRLVALGGVPTVCQPIEQLASVGQQLNMQKNLTEILHALNLVSGQAVEIQLKILQTLLSVLTYCTDVHNEPLGDALLLCFKLQESRVSVVSSTAAATLRQAIMLVFDRVVDDTTPPHLTLELPSEPPSLHTVTPSALDAFDIFSDLCLLTAKSSGGSSFWATGDKEKSRLLRLDSLSRTFGLELIESILSGYESIIQRFVLRHALHPLILRLQTEKPSFPVALRVFRLIYVLIRHYTDQLPMQIEAYLTYLIRVGAAEAEPDSNGRKENTAWLRVLSLEVLRGICGDAALLQHLWTRYDSANGTKLYSRLVTALSKLLHEKPELLGVGAQMYGINLPSDAAANTGYLDMGIGMVTSAASAGVSTVSAIMGNGSGLSATSAPKQRLLEQHDKNEPPIMPETYVYLLALWSLQAVANGIYASCLDTASSPILGMAESAWPALLAAMSFVIATDLSDALFADVLLAIQNFTIACDALDMTTPRDAFINTLGKYAVPPPVVAAMQTYLENPGAQRNNSVIGSDTLNISATLGIGSGATPPSLSERNLACLRSLIAVAQRLAPRLGDAWHDVLETLQNANYLLATSRRSAPRRPTTTSPQLAQTGAARTSGEYAVARPDILQDLDGDSIRTAIGSLFETSTEMDDAAFTTFATALCRLSAEMIGLDVARPLVVDITEGNTPTSPNFTLPLSPPIDASRRRTSGIQISQSIKSGERSFGLSKLRIVATLNLARLVSSPPDVGWNVITQHLLAVARHITAASTIRIQASDTLTDVLLASVRIGKEPRVQHQVFDVLVRQVDVYPISAMVSTDYDVRAAGYATLNQILESSGHSLEVGWSTIFAMLDSVCRSPLRVTRNDSHASDLSALSSQRPAPARPTTTFNKGDANLVRTAFPSLTLICTDFLSLLDDESMLQCIGCLACFGKQTEDVNIALAAVGLLWTVSDAVQRERKGLWLDLLTELLELGRDGRSEVRSSAMHTLFRCVELYGASLEPAVWEDVLWKVIFPLLERLPGDDTHVLALTSVGSIISQSIDRIARLHSFVNIYQHLLDRLKRSFISEPRACGSAALAALDRILGAVSAYRQMRELDSLVDDAWNALRDMADALSSAEAYTQDNLVILVRNLSRIHDLLPFDDKSLADFSRILRNIMAYARSPEYRPDTDNMSPLQKAIVELVANSRHLGANLILADLAEFASLAYVSDSGKLTYVALSKWCMPKIAAVVEHLGSRGGLNVDVMVDGTIEGVISAFVLPIKLKHDCPPPNKYGNDPPLWRIAIPNAVRVLDIILRALDSGHLSNERRESIWMQVMEVFGGIVLAENVAGPDELADESFVQPHLAQLDALLSARFADDGVPDRIVATYADTLRKASILYRHDVRADQGTTAEEVELESEDLRYWALDALIRAANVVSPTAATTLSRYSSRAIITRFEGALQQYVNDARVRGQLPFSRTREVEVLYILRQMISLRIAPGSLSTPELSPLLAAAYASSCRPHLFKLYTILLDIAFIAASPTLWLGPFEYRTLFDNASITADPSIEIGGGHQHAEAQAETPAARDSRIDDIPGTDDLVAVTATELARRCLELVGCEMREVSIVGSVTGCP